mgnify:CR=1 FL=1
MIVYGVLQRSASQYWQVKNCWFTELTKDLSTFNWSEKVLCSSLIVKCPLRNTFTGPTQVKPVIAQGPASFAWTRVIMINCCENTSQDLHNLRFVQGSQNVWLLSKLLMRPSYTHNNMAIYTSVSLTLLLYCLNIYLYLPTKEQTLNTLKEAKLQKPFTAVTSSFYPTSDIPWVLLSHFPVLPVSPRYTSVSRLSSHAFPLKYKNQK